MKPERMSRAEENTRAILCVLAVLAVAALAAYLGVWLLFVGGIVQVIEGVKATPVSGSDVALGILRFAVAWPVGIGSFFIGASIASLLWPRRRMF